MRGRERSRLQQQLLFELLERLPRSKRVDKANTQSRRRGASSVGFRSYEFSWMPVASLSLTCNSREERAPAKPRGAARYACDGLPATSPWKDTEEIGGDCQALCVGRLFARAGGS